MLILCRAKAYLCCVREILKSQLDSTSANQHGTLHQLWPCYTMDHAAAEGPGLARGILGLTKLLI